MRVCVVCAVEFAILRARATKIFQYSVRRGWSFDRFGVEIYYIHNIIK